MGLTQIHESPLPAIATGISIDANHGTVAVSPTDCGFANRAVLQASAAARENLRPRADEVVSPDRPEQPFHPFADFVMEHEQVSRQPDEPRQSRPNPANGFIATPSSIGGGDLEASGGSQWGNPGRFHRASASSSGVHSFPFELAVDPSAGVEDHGPQIVEKAARSGTTC